MQDLGSVIYLVSMSYDQNSTFYSLNIETRQFNQLLKSKISLGCGAQVCVAQGRKEQKRRQGYQMESNSTIFIVTTWSGCEPN